MPAAAFTRERGRYWGYAYDPAGRFRKGVYCQRVYLLRVSLVCFVYTHIHTLTHMSGGTHGWGGRLVASSKTQGLIFFSRSLMYYSYSGAMRCIGGIRPCGCVSCSIAALYAVMSSCSVLLGRPALQFIIAFGAADVLLKAWPRKLKRLRGPSVHDTSQSANRAEYLRRC